MNTPLSSFQLEAFAAVARLGSFSAAASALRLSQPGLSSRVGLLEEQLQTSLLKRTAVGATLTDAGKQLYAYVLQKEALELEAVANITGGPGDRLSGVVRVAGLSSLIPSLAVPLLAPLFRKHPEAQVEFTVARSVDLPRLVSRREADVVLLDTKVVEPGVETRELGKESYVAIESTKHDPRRDTYLDTDRDDPVTGEFFEAQKGTAPKYHRLFLHDNSGILAGVANGLGCAVVERRMIPSGFPVRIIKGYRPMVRPIWICFPATPFPSRLHIAVRDRLLEAGPTAVRDR